MSDLNMFYGKMSDFVSISFYRLALVIKPTNFNFERHGNILIKKDMVSDLNMSLGKTSDFVSVLLFNFITLVIKLRNVDFKGQ